MALTLQQKSDVRRHLGYPVAGLARQSPAGGTLQAGNVGYRFFQAYGQLEYRMNNMNADEEARLMGMAYGAVALVGIAPSTGDTVTVTISNPGEFVAQALLVTAALGDTGLMLVAKLAVAAAQNSVLQTAGFMPIAPYGTGPFSGAQNNPAQSISTPIPEVAFVRPAAFSIAVASTGAMGPVVVASGSLLDPRAVVDPSTDPATTIYGYVPILNWLHGAIAESTQNLDTSKADVWTARGTEVDERRGLYNLWQCEMSSFLGVPINPNRWTGRSGLRAVV